MECGDSDKHLWQIAAVRDLIILLVVAATCWFIYLLSDIVLPILIAAILADIFNPFVTLLERRCSCPRPLIAALIVLIIIAVVFGFIAWLAPLIYNQFIDLTDKLPDYLRALTRSYGINFDDVLDQLDRSIQSIQAEPRKLLGQVFSTTGHALGIVTAVFSTTANFFFGFAIVLIYLFIFIWHFNSAIAAAEHYLPRTRKDQIVAIAKRMDKVITEFFRGRIVIAFIVGALLSIGWLVTGVPYWFFLGMATGVLNIVPYLAIITWPAAIVLKYVDSLTSGGAANLNIVVVTLWPSIVYVVVQFLDGWILTPWIQSGQTNMSAATILIVVFIGAAVGGVWGLLFAIPVAACLKIMIEELVLPRIKEWVASH